MLTGAKLKTFSQICKFFASFLHICKILLTFAFEHRHDVRLRTALRTEGLERCVLIAVTPKH